MAILSEVLRSNKEIKKIKKKKRNNKCPHASLREDRPVYQGASKTY